MLKKAAETRRAAPNPIVPPASMTKAGGGSAASPAAARGRGPTSAAPGSTAVVSELQDSVKVKDGMIQRLEKDLAGVKAELREAKTALGDSTPAEVTKMIDFHKKALEVLTQNGWKTQWVTGQGPGGKPIKRRMGAVKFIGKLISDRDVAEIRVKVCIHCADACAAR